MFNTSRIKPILIALAALAALAVPASAEAKKPSITVKDKQLTLGQTARGSASSVSRSCRLDVSGQKVKLTRKRTKASWSYRASEAGIYAATLRCGRLKDRVNFEVSAPSEESEAPESPVDGSTPATPTTPSTPPVQAPRLTGTDAEAEIYWRGAKHLFERVNSRGWCADYAYFKRPDIPERVEKAAYKQWIQDGGLMWDENRNWVSVNSFKDPHPTDFYQQNHRYANWNAYPGSSADAWVTGARRAGLRAERLPFPGAIWVISGHVAYVEAILPNLPDDSPGTVRFSFSDMSASHPGIVRRGADFATEQRSIAGNDWFVG